MAFIHHFLAAWLFYTRIPLPFLEKRHLRFEKIAPWVPVVGLCLGGLLALEHWILSLGLPNLVRAVVLVGSWIAMTGGFHLDGVADAADGLAVSHHRSDSLATRLTVMADSRVGAFGVMAVVMLVLLKVTTVAALRPDQTWVLILVPTWGRWSQLVAIGCYPYLKEQGQGRFLKDSTQFPQDLWPTTLGLVAVTAVVAWLWHLPVIYLSLWTLAAMGLAFLVGYWYYHQFHGQTGDTYGAIVEWTEALLLTIAVIEF